MLVFDATSDSQSCNVECMKNAEPYCCKVKCLWNRPTEITESLKITKCIVNEKNMSCFVGMSNGLNIFTKPTTPNGDIQKGAHCKISDSKVSCYNGTKPICCETTCDSNETCIKIKDESIKCNASDVDEKWCFKNFPCLCELVEHCKSYKPSFHKGLFGLNTDSERPWKGTVIYIVIFIVIVICIVALVGIVSLKSLWRKYITKRGASGTGDGQHSQLDLKEVRGQPKYKEVSQVE